MTLAKNIFVSLVILSVTLMGQVTYQGPESGSIASGVTVNTDDFSTARSQSSGVPRYKIFNHISPERLPDYLNNVPAAGPEGSNYVQSSNFKSPEDSLIITASYDGIEMRGDNNGFLHIPPDTYIAVGPNHIIQIVNTEFRITDRQGNEIKSIWADEWYSTLGVTNVSSFDPKIIYDKFNGRWVMVWLHQNDATSEAYYLISVSDDDDPTGVWFNWALPSTTNGNTPAGNWSDYEGLGYDYQAIYITGRQFAFGGGKQYEKIRIIPNSQLYISSDPGTVRWKDLWNISYPGVSNGPDGIRPARMMNVSDTMYFAIESPFITGTSVGIYRLLNPASSPVLEGTAVPVTTFYNPSDPDQLGGGTPKIDGGGSRLRNEPVYRDGVLHLVHSVRNGSKSAIHYVAIDAATNALLKDITFGDADHYHTYPAVAVGKNNDVVVSYSRGADDEYMGAGFTVIPFNSSPSSDQIMSPGYGNYIVTFGGSRNRWGDYNGAAVDPADENNFVLFAEYAKSTNKWGNWVTEVRARPFDNQTIFSEVDSLDFGEVEIPDNSQFFDIVIKNYGVPDLTISNIANSLTDKFEIKNPPSLPVVLSSYETLDLQMRFVPGADIGFFYDTLKVESDDPANPVFQIALQGRGYEIPPVAESTLYGSSAPNNVTGKLLTINSETGAGTEIGDLEWVGVTSLTIYPPTKELFGMKVDGDSTFILRINSETGDAHLWGVVNDVLNAISFDAGGRLLAVTSSMQIIQIDENSGVTVLSTLDLVPKTLAVNPADSTMWFTKLTGTSTADLYKVKPDSGTYEKVVSLGIAPTDMAFDETGDLVAAYTNSTKLAVIDINTGEETLIGSVGISRVKGLAVIGDLITDVSQPDESELIPNDFALLQNHPNPFNPSTIIQFNLPSESKVTLTIFNILGEKVAELLNSEISAGYHRVNFDASRLSSGVYIYKLNAVSAEGRKFSDSKKMILMK